MATESKAILDELKAIRAEIAYLKDHIVDSDVLLTEEDITAIKKAEEDLKHKKTVRLI